MGFFPHVFIFYFIYTFIYFHLCIYLHMYLFISTFIYFYKNSSVKGCVNDMSECRYNCRRNGLKEMRWNSIKRASCRVIKKDDFGDFCLRE